MIEVSEQVEVAATPRAVWDLLSDPHSVVDCVPGAQLGEQHEDGSFDAMLTVKFGPAKVNFRVRVSMDLDSSTMTGRVSSKGKDDQGGTRMRGAMTFRVLERAEPPGASIPIDAQVEVSGKLAMLVEGGAKLVVKRMTSEFSERLAARFAEGSIAPATVAEQQLKGE